MSTILTAPKSISRPDLEKFFSAIDDKIEASQPHITRPDLDVFFSTVGRKVEQAQEQQCTLDKHEATRFNIFNLIEPDENKLSDIIAGLLDPEGTHGQGDLFLRLLLKQLGLNPNPEGIKKAVIQREAPTHGIYKFRRRMDILVDTGTLVAIENKVDAKELQDQVKDYLDHLDYCSRSRSIWTLLIYLTPEGRDPDSLTETILEKAKSAGKLFCWSYLHDFRRWLEVCKKASEAQKTSFFLSDFISYIDSTMKRGSDANEEEDRYEE